MTLRRALLSVGVLVLACTLITSCFKAPRESGDRFHLYILDIQWARADPDLGYSTETAWPVLGDLQLSDSSIWVITEQDVEVYDWAHQTITLTIEATFSLYSAFSEDDLFDWISLGQAFVVTYDGQWVYGGVFYEGGGAAGIRFPVIHLDYGDGSQLGLILRSQQGCWMFTDPFCVEDLQYPPIHALFVEEGKLQE